MTYKFIFLIFTLFIINSLQIKQSSEYLSISLHKACLQQSLKNGKHFDEVSAIICGKKITNSKAKELFLSNGLIHIFVVSGAHLSFYKKIINFMVPSRASNILTLFFLFMYSMTCLFSAPIFRAFIEQTTTGINSYFKLNQDKNLSLLITAIICVVIEPGYLNSVSLPMSWVASICMNQKKSPAKTLIIFLSLMPILLTFTLPNPLSAFSSFFLTGLISFFILPLNLLFFLVPDISLVSDLFYECLYWLLELIQPNIPELFTNQQPPTPVIICWLYALTLNLALIIRTFYLEQKSEPL